MSEPRVWWSPPGSKEIFTMEASDSGTSCFRFLPFITSEKHPSLEWRGHVVLANMPQPGTVEVRSPWNGASTTQTEHEVTVKEALRKISMSKLDKVVVARVKSIKTSATPEATFALKCEAHQDSFVYLINHPSCGVWCGATPELLVSASDNRVETVSLAGTRITQSNSPLNGFLKDWTSKEKEEQELVTKYIKSVLESHGATEMSIEPLPDRQYGNLVHLETRFRCSIKGNINALANDLHPTPAVGGRPLTQAFEFIRINERLPRAYYAGFLGVTTASGSAYYVNLRTAEWMQGGVRLYAGGGIVNGSIPKDEWIETEAKIMSIRETLG